MIKAIRNDIKLYMVWFASLVLIALGVITTSYLSILAFAIFFIYCILSPSTNSCVLLFGLMPFANVFKTNSEGTSLFTFCQLIFVVWTFINSKKTKNSLLISISLLVVYVLTIDIPEFNYLLIIKLALGFYMIYIATSQLAKNHVVNLSYMLAISTILMMLLTSNASYFTYVEPYLGDLNYLIDSTGHASDTMRMGGFLGDPNYCAVLIIVVLCLLTVLYYYGNIKNEFWIFVVFLVPLGFATYSKSYFLALSAWVLFLILFVLIKKHKVWAIIASACVGVVVFLAIAGKIEAFNIIFMRFSSSDVTTGRGSLNEIYLTYILNHPKTLFLGNGISAHVLAQAGNNVHNIYIETLFKLGLVGSLLYVVTLCLAFNVKKTEKKGLINFLPLVFIMVLYFFLAGLDMYTLPFYFSLAFLAINFNSMPE